VTLSSRKAGRIKESQAATRKVLSMESAAFQEVAVPPLSPPEVDDNDFISHN